MQSETTPRHSRRALLWFSFPVVAVVALAAFTLGYFADEVCCACGGSVCAAD